ncbi:MAG TPA: NADH-quinone oxidoreductase subunit H [Vicinamibacterales bacterium]|nr:NADH-quinone oxidoreductase subunit H [Vicinamibacterales bacterium]
MNAAATAIAWSLAWLALVLFASPLIEGVMRKVKAIVHSRQGPPIVQPYLDLAKLLVKEDLAGAPGAVARLAPPAAFACVLAAAFLVPFGVAPPAAAAGDLFVFVYLITLSSVCVMAAGLAHPSPFSHLGSSREMMMVITAEAVIVISLVALAVAGHGAVVGALAPAGLRLSSLVVLVCYLFAMQALLGKLPFDIPEAEQELMEGPFVEYSGPSLALFKWTFYMKQLIFGALFFHLFVGWPRVAGWGAAGALLNVAITLVAVLVLGLLVVLIDATNPRLRIDQSLRVFAVLIGVATLGAGLAALGW